MTQRWRVTIIGVIEVGVAYVQLFLACSSSGTQPREKTPPESAAASAEYKETAAVNARLSYLIGGKTYYPPVALWYSDIWMEGGTQFVRMVDARGEKLMACNDRRGYINPKDEPIGRPIYIDAEHPTHEGSKPMPLGGADGQELYRMLKYWADGGNRWAGHHSGASR